MRLRRFESYPLHQELRGKQGSGILANTIPDEAGVAQW
jgi:hypothetical protein